MYSKIFFLKVYLKWNATITKTTTTIMMEETNINSYVEQINWPMMRTKQQQQQMKTKTAAATRTSRKGMVLIWRFAHIWIKKNENYS
jgi:hypothetical protein